MKIKVISENTQKTLVVEEENTLLDILRQRGYNVPALCGGNGTCGKCKIKIENQILDVKKAEQKHLSEEQINNGYRLACLHKPKEDMIIRVEEKKNYKIVSDFDANKIGRINKRNTTKLYSIAIDIGTTTVAVSLLNTNTGKVIYNTTFLNPQQQYGADVISRIDYVNKTKNNVLTELITNNIDKAIRTSCSIKKVNKEHIQNVVIVGNTTMLYLLQQFNPYELAVSPFTATHKDMHIYRYNSLFSDFLECQVILLPCVSAYIGADITSGMYFLGNEILNKKIIFIDLGTNGEIVLSDGEYIYCASAAAGPAFEGASIKDGVGSIDGAICNIKIENEKIEYSTINNEEPVGICGSAIIDVTAECIKHSLVKRTGKLKKDKIKITENNICFYQKDIREVQLAKSAIFSGIKVLLDEAKLNFNDIEKLYLAGGFGKHINIENACEVGVIPKEMKNKTEVVGNSSLGGAVKYLLDSNSKDNVNKIINKCKYVELSMDMRFNNFFVENMGF